MKASLILLFCWYITSFNVLADVWVEGYYRSDGTYVQGHYRTAPNDTKADNWSTRGNINPHTGKPGTRTYENYSNYNGGNTRSSYSNYSEYELPGYYGADGEFYHDNGSIYFPYIPEEENDSTLVGYWKEKPKPYKKSDITYNDQSSIESSDFGFFLVCILLFSMPWYGIVKVIGFLQYIISNDESIKAAEYFSGTSVLVATVVTLFGAFHLFGVI